MVLHTDIFESLIKEQRQIPETVVTGDEVWVPYAIMLPQSVNVSLNNAVPLVHHLDHKADSLDLEGYGYSLLGQERSTRC